MCRRHDGEADLLPIVDLAVLLPPQNTATTESLRGFSYEAGLAVGLPQGDTSGAQSQPEGGTWFSSLVRPAENDLISIVAMKRE